MSLVISSSTSISKRTTTRRRENEEPAALFNNINTSPSEKISVAEMLVVIYVAPVVQERNENGYQSIGPPADLQGFI